MKLRSSQMLCNDEGRVIMGSGRMAILDSVNKTGSINRTAKELKMAYKTVWSKIKSTEKNFGKSIVIADKKQGTKLTDEGKDLLNRYRKLKQKCLKADDAIFEEIFSDL